MEQGLVVSFGTSGGLATITRNTGTWSGYAEGDYLYVGGDTTNQTDKAGYFKIGAINGATISLVAGQRVNTELNRAITVANAVRDPLHASATITHVIVTRHDDVDIAVDGLVSARPAVRSIWAPNIR